MNEDTNPAETPSTVSAPQVETHVSLGELAGRDARAAHFLVDVLAGTDPAEAAAARFGTARETEAEQRGYLRGLNEAAHRRLTEPSMFEQPVPGGATAAPAPLPPAPRRSIWDNA